MAKPGANWNRKCFGFETMLRKQPLLKGNRKENGFSLFFFLIIFNNDLSSNSRPKIES